MSKRKRWLKSFKEFPNNIKYIRDRLCERCERELLPYWLNDGKIFSRQPHCKCGKTRSKYYCEDCYNDLYNGVQLVNKEIAL